MNLDDWARVLAPVLAPVVLGLIITAVGAVFTTARRLRQTIAADLAILEKLPADSTHRTDLEEDVRRRTHLLVAYSGYPAVTRRDVLLFITALSLVGVTASSRLLFAETGDNRLIYVLDWAFMIAFYAAALAAFRRLWVSWSTRAHERYRFVDKRISTVETDELITVFTAVEFMGAVIVSTLLAVATTFATFPEGALIALISGGVAYMVAFTSCRIVIQRSPLGLLLIDKQKDPSLLRRWLRGSGGDTVNARAADGRAGSSHVQD